MSVIFDSKLTGHNMLIGVVERDIEAFHRMASQLCAPGETAEVYRDREPLGFQLAMKTAYPTLLLRRIKAAAFQTLGCSEEIDFDGSRYWVRFLAT